MRKTRALYRTWLRDYLQKRQPDLVPQMLAAINAYDRILDKKRLDAKSLAPIVEAASSSRRPLYENATEFLAGLTADYALARESVEGMAANSRNHVRFNAILCLNEATPLDFTLRIIRQGLQDKSANVRGKAADWAGRLRLRQVVSDLEAAFAVEKNKEARETIEFELRLLRDGYILERDEEGMLQVTAFTPNGVATGYFEAAEIEERGIDSIVAEFASDPLG
jgi:hypothetical protein